MVSFGKLPRPCTGRGDGIDRRLVGGAYAPPKPDERGTVVSEHAGEKPSVHRARWAAIGAAVAVTLGAGGYGIASATVSSGERAAFVPISPCRVMDTRPLPDQVGTRDTPLGTDTTYTIPVVGFCGVPLDATGVVMNVTAVGPTADSFLTVYPQGATQPLASSLNYRAGQGPTPNAVTVDVPATGGVSFYNRAGSVNVIADIVGYYVDHDHDDRYYTKLQVDRRTMFAVVNVDGTLRRGSAGVTSAEVTSGVKNGDYTVTFPRNVSGCGFVASPTSAIESNNPIPGEVGAKTSNVTDNGVYVQFFDSTGGEVAGPFTLIVNCP
jgi:hypothetical protein